MPKIIVAPCYVKNLGLVEMIAQNNRINVTLSPEELELRIKFPEAISDEDRLLVLQALTAFRDRHADVVLEGSLRGSAEILPEGVFIYVKSRGGPAKLRIRFSRPQTSKEVA